MSGGKQSANKRSYLTEEYCEKTNAIPFVTSDGAVLNILDAFICPICLNIINKEDIDNITLEHVPPKSVGGNPLLVTCSHCNNTLGSEVDNCLCNELLIYHLIRHPENTTFKATYTLNGVQIKGRMKLDLKAERPTFKFTIDANDRVKYPTFTKELINNWDGCDLQVVSEITGTKRNEEYSNISVLKSAYLMAFAKMGYMYILQDSLDNVRAQIQNRNKKILSNAYLVGRGIEIMPEVQNGVYYGFVNDTRCVLVIMTLRLKKKDASSHRVVVALPHPDDKDDFLYKKLSKMDEIKKISKLEEVGILATKPIKINESLNDILDKSKSIQNDLTDIE